MPKLHQFLHAPRLRTGWRTLLVVLILIATMAALAPGAGAPSLGIGDKLDHLLAFVALAVAAALSWPTAWSHTVGAGVGLLAYGAFIEFAQTRVPGRHGDMLDLAVDAAGIALGLALVHGLRGRWPAPKT